MSFPTTELEEFAKQHDVNLESVTPLTSDERMRALEALLTETDVPFPISPSKAAAYLDASHRPFKVGTLSDETIDLSKYSNHQDYEALTFEEHLSWACLIKDQRAAKRQYACKEYLWGEDMFPINGTVIPDYHFLNARLYQQTGWQLATVNTIIPSSLFFRCHRYRFFPVTNFMRALGTDYLEEPDIGHDVAGHIATFTIPQVAEVMNNHGVAHERISEVMNLRLKSAKTEKEKTEIAQESELLSLYAGRIYWFTVEFGLVMQGERLVAFGAGILSSPGETHYSVDSKEASRILIDPTSDRDLLRLATTDHLIDEYQKTYFVMKDLESLSSITPERILSIVEEAYHLPHLGWRDVLEDDILINVGSEAMAPHKKYELVSRNEPIDEASRRVVLRNIALPSIGPENHLNPAAQTFLDSHNQTFLIE